MPSDDFLEAGDQQVRLDLYLHNGAAGRGCEYAQIRGASEAEFTSPLKGVIFGGGEHELNVSVDVRNLGVSV